MPDPGRSAAPIERPDATRVMARPGRRPVHIRYRKAQPRRDRIGLLEAQAQALADGVAGGAHLALQRARRLVIVEALGAEGRDRHQPIPTQPLDRREKTEW